MHNNLPQNQVSACLFGLGTQAMLVCFLQDMKEYFKKTALLSEDKTYTRIFKMAETMEKYIPHFYCFTNITVHLINHLRMKIDDVFIQNIKEI